MSDIDDNATGEDGQIPEFVRQERGGRGFGRFFVVGGIVLFLIVVGAGGAFGGVTLAQRSRNATEAAAIAATVEAFATATATAVPTLDPNFVVPTDPPPTVAPTATPATEESGDGDGDAAAGAEDAGATPTATNTSQPSSGAAGQPPAATQPPLPTSTPVPTATPAAPLGSRGITGTLQMCNNKPSYAAQIEGVCVIETIRNNTADTIPYGILGVYAENASGGQSIFHTSWRGNLSIGGNCTGPVDSCGGPHRDEGLRLDAGSYTLTMQICYSAVDTCLNGGEWETLSAPIAIQVIDWTPAP